MRYFTGDNMNKEYALTDPNNYGDNSKTLKVGSEDELTVAPPDPFHLILSHELFLAIRDNQGFAHQAGVTRPTANEFDKFKRLFKTFLELLNKQDPTAFSILSTIMTMWGYSRKYCGMCGKPIIGRPGHIENRMVCAQCGASFRIADRLYQKEDHHFPPRKQPPQQAPRPQLKPPTKDQSNSDKR